MEKYEEPISRNNTIFRHGVHVNKDAIDIRTFCGRTRDALARTTLDVLTVRVDRRLARHASPFVWAAAALRSMVA